MVLAHTVFITLHALSAGLALVCGIVLLHTGRGLRAHQAGVVAMAATLGPSLYFGWPRYPPTARVAFVALAGLALVMVAQAVRAGRLGSLPQRRPRLLAEGPGIAPGLVGVVGFNVVSLTVAGTIVPVLRIGGGTLGVLLAVAGSVTVAHLLVRRRRLLAEGETGSQERRAKALGGGGGLRPTA
jgi:uncharacterized membrane protein